MQPDQHSKWLKERLRAVEKGHSFSSLGAATAYHEALRHYEESGPCLSVGEVQEKLLGEAARVAAVEAHGGSLIPYEEEMMREALEAALDKAFPPEDEEGGGGGVDAGVPHPQGPERVSSPDHNASVDSATTSTQQGGADDGD